MTGAVLLDPPATPAPRHDPLVVNEARKLGRGCGAPGRRVRVPLGYRCPRTPRLFAQRPARPNRAQRRATPPPARSTTPVAPPAPQAAAESVASLDGTAPPLLPVVGFGGGPGASPLSTGSDSFIDDQCHLTFDIYGPGAYVRFDIVGTQTAAGYTWSQASAQRCLYFISKWGLKALANVHFQSSNASYNGYTSVPDVDANGKCVKLANFAKAVVAFGGPGGSFTNGSRVTLDVTMGSATTSANLANAPTLHVGNSSRFHSTGGTASILGDTFTYSGTAAGQLTGIPTTGSNALLAHPSGSAVVPVETVSGFGGITDYETHNEPNSIGSCAGLLLDPAHPYYPGRIFAIIRDTAEAIHQAQPTARVVGFAFGDLSNNAAAPAGTAAGRRDRTLIDLLNYAYNPANGTSGVPQGMFGTRVTTAASSGDTVLHVGTTACLHSSGTAWVAGTTIHYTAKTATTLTGVSGIPSGGFATGTRLSQTGAHVDDHSGHIYQDSSDAATSPGFNVRNINSVPVSQAIIDGHAEGSTALPGFWMTEGFAAGSYRWNMYQPKYPTPAGPLYQVPASYKAAGHVTWESTTDVLYATNHQHPVAQIDQETQTRHAADAITSQLAAGTVRWVGWIPHVAIDGMMPQGSSEGTSDPSTYYWQYCRGAVRLPVTNNNWSPSSAVFTRYIGATATGGRGGGFGSSQWKPVAYALYDRFNLGGGSAATPPPEPTFMDPGGQPPNPDTSTTPHFAWTNTQTTNIEHRLRIDGGAWLTFAGQSGSYTVPGTGALTYGAHTVEIQAHDTSTGLFSDATLTYSWTINFAGTTPIPRTGFVPVIHQGTGATDSIADPSCPPGTIILLHIAKMHDDAEPTIPAGWTHMAGNLSDHSASVGIRSDLLGRMLTGTETWPLALSLLGTESHQVIVTAYDGGQGPSISDALITAALSLTSGGALSAAVQAPPPPDLDTDECLVLALGAIRANTSLSTPAGYAELYDSAYATGGTITQALDYRDADQADMPLPTVNLNTPGATGVWVGHGLAFRGAVYEGPVIVDTFPSSGTTSTTASMTYHHPVQDATFFVSLDGSAFVEDSLLPGGVPGAVTYTGLAVGQHTWEVYAQLPGGAFTPVATRGWAQVNATPPPPQTAVAHRLGCGEYQARLLTRGGAYAAIQDVPWLGITYQRGQNDTYGGKLTIPVNDRQLKATLEGVHTMSHEVVLSRDGVDQFIGVVTGLAGAPGQLEVSYQDLAFWLKRRKVRNDHVYTAPTDAAEILAAIIGDALAVDNSMGITVEWEPCGQRIAYQVLAADNRYAMDVAGDLAPYVTWTTLLRSIIITPSPGTDLTPRFLDEAFAVTPTPVEDGTQAGNHISDMGGSGSSGATATGIAQDDASAAFYGVLEQVVSSPSGATTKPELDAEAASLLPFIAEPPVTISGGTYSDHAPVLIEELVPGRRHLLDLASPALAILNTYTLQGITVQVDGTASEQVQPAYYGLPTP